MKTMCSSFLFLLLSITLLAQIEVGSEWTYTYNDFGYLRPEVVKIERDTIIDNQNWLILDGIDRCANSFSNSLIRAQGKKVYLLNLPTGEESLLYDFDLTTGDSYEIPIFGSGITYTINIDSIGTINLNGKDYRVQYIDNVEFGRYIIEDIGSEHYLVPQGNICDPQYFGLRCFSTSERFIDFNLERDCDASYFDIRSSNSEIELIEEFTIFPNPSHTGFINIKTTSDVIDEIEILDLQGRNLKTISTFYASDKIDVKELNQGFYFLKIVMEEKVFLKKIYFP